MKKILTIAIREYRAMVGTKAFLISIIMMPILMMGSLLAIELMKNAGEIKDRHLAVIDHSGKFIEHIKAAADAKNALIDAPKTPPESPEDDEDKFNAEDVEEDFLGKNRDRYIIEVIEPETANDDLKVQLSDRIRNQQLYAFVEIPELAGSADAGEDDQVRFYAQDSSLSEARGWIGAIVNELVRADRLAKANIDPVVVQAAATPVPVVGMGLAVRGPDGEIQTKEEDDAMAAIFLPMGVMLMMFMVIFMSAQPMLESVLEEKSQRIAEVLLGSANPFQLMSGKLLGTVAGSLTIFGIYLIGAYFIAVYRGYTDQIPFHLTPWFITFQVLGVLFYAAIFLAIGASVSQLKEAQALLLPVWMLLMSPLFIWIFMVREPLGKLATYFSFFPPATPVAMMLRLATGQAIPIWQPILGAVLTAISTVFIVVIAARIFRIGILWQGKTPKISEILRWAITG